MKMFCFARFSVAAFLLLHFSGLFFLQRCDLKSLASHSFLCFLNWFHFCIRYVTAAERTFCVHQRKRKSEIPFNYKVFTLVDCFSGQNRFTALQNNNSIEYGNNDDNILSRCFKRDLLSNAEDTINF